MATLLSLSSCSNKKKDAVTPAVTPNVFTYDSTSYTIDKGYFVIQHDETKDIDYGVIRLSSRNLSELAGGSTAITHMLDIQYTPTTIVTGTFTFKDTADASFNKSSNFFGSSAIFNLFTENTIGLNALAPSTVTISKEGENYKIVYDLTVRENKKVTGTFVGALITE
ncbi:hypothetical protein FLA_1475 [Filimonas lacunae]|nr:hypothetical protein FLA_1475 [Filimonas lacunae]